MPGNVYVFNSTSEAVGTLTGNGASMGGIAAWQPAGGGQPYAPEGIVVPRVISSDEGAGFTGADNAVQVGWAMANASFNINIPMPPEGPSLQNDLVLYLTFSLAILEDSIGNVLGVFQMQQ